MKKRFALIAVLVIVGTLMAPLEVSAEPAAAPAKESDKLKVYYSEPIGAGKKVFHITSCKKEVIQSPVRCEKKPNEEKAVDFVNQCEKNGKVVAGTLVRGCHTKSDADKNNPYPLSREKAQRFEPGKTKCKEGEEEEMYLYGIQYAIVAKPTGLNSGDETQWVFKGATASKTGAPNSDTIKSVLGLGKSDQLPANIEAVPQTRATLCVSWDVVDDKGTVEDAEKFDGGGAPTLTQQLFSDAQPLGEALRVAGCNNDNSSTASGINASDVSTPYNLVNSIHCSISERIEGRTGSELFGNYISALYRWAASIVGIIGVLILVASGIQISIAGGDTAKIDEAKQRIMQSLVGIAILFLSGLILYTINPGFFTG